MLDERCMEEKNIVQERARVGSTFEGMFVGRLEPETEVEILLEALACLK